MECKIKCFEGYLKELLDLKEYEEIFLILSYFNYKKTPFPLLKIMISACYRLKKYNTCIDLCDFLITNGYDADYFIFEVYAESSYQKNKLRQSFDLYKKALSLRPSLKLASYRVLTLGYRLDYILNQPLLNKIEKIALETQNLNYLRSVAYIQMNEGLYESAYGNLKILLEKSKQFYYPDLLSVCNVIEKINSKKSFLSTRSLRKEFDTYNAHAEALSFDYKFESNNSETLFITLAPASGFLFQKYEYSSDKLFLVDGTGTYFILSYEIISKFILELVTKYKYKNISIAGSSKGGTGVILLLNKLQGLLSDINIKAVSFSPQIKLWPFNKNLTIPSYRVLSEYVDCNPVLREAFSKGVKDISFDINPHCELSIFYGNKFNMDRIEASNISNSSKQVSIIELDYSGHGTSIPLTIPENKTEDELRKRYANLPIDPDFAELGGDKLVDIVDEIFAIYSNPEMRLHKFLC